MRIPAAVSRRSRRLAKRWRWRAARAIGVDRYTWSALDDLDHRLVELFQAATGGTFVELGANDGLQQSNTLALETLYGWRGLLIEADPQLTAECHRNRPHATVICAAAAPAWGTRQLVPADLVGHIAAGDDQAERAVLVTAAPLSDLIEAAGLGPTIDLLSIDVEGNELEVLAGLDLQRHAPRHLLVETQQPDAVLEALGPRYERTATWSHHDHVFSRCRADETPP